MSKYAVLMSSAAAAALCMAVPALARAQTADGSRGAALEEVVVTATRQTSTVNKVALSLSAVTQKSLDQQGVKSVDDLSRQVPGFTFRKTGPDANPNLTIRGIGGNAAAGRSGGSPTTGLYLDDVGLQQRSAAGLISGSNQPAPVLFDLDRVEVLRGPQGTLYGGAAEGGAIRFITPAPSLTTYSGQIRTDVGFIQDGGISHDVGVAVGGPIIADKVGFRIAVAEDARAGWLDNYNQYTGKKFYSDNNRGNDYSVNAKLLWRINPNFKATVTLFSQMNYDQDSGLFRTDTPALNVGAATAAGRILNNTGTVNGVRFSFPASVFPQYTIPAQNFYGVNRGEANGLYTSTNDASYVASPRRTIINVPSLTLDYNLGDKLGLKSITAYDVQRTSGWSFGGGSAERSGSTVRAPAMPLAVLGGVVPQYLMTAINPTTKLIDGGTYPLFGFAYSIYNNKRDAYSEELRIQTTDPSDRLQFVAGLYYDHAHTHVTTGSEWNESALTEQLRGVGISEPWFVGGTLTPLMQVPGRINVELSTRDGDILEDEIAGFGEATFAVTDKLKITAGGRITSYTQKFAQTSGGAVTGAPAGFVGTSSRGPGTIETNPNSLTPFPTNYAACPTNDSTKGCPYVYTLNNLKETPITPKASISYQLTPTDLVYFTYAEGFRVGGVNPPVFTVTCAPDLALLGLAAAPSTYQHDTTKSYELGGKFRLFDGRMQVNSALFKIDWQNIQFTNQLRSCGSSYVANGPSAVSEGFETSITGRVADFTLNTNIAYDKAVYAQDVLSVPSQGAASAKLALKGDNLGTPDWTVNAGVQYDHRFFDLPAYARVDYMYTGKYDRTTGPGTNGYVASTHDGNATHTMNARAGFYYKQFEMAVYVKNLTNSNEWIDKVLITNTQFLFTGTGLQPRTIGAQVNYRF